MKRGFTLIEVVIVIGIIGLLTVIVFPSINNIRAKNRDAEKISDIAAIQLGLSMYYSQHQSEGYPLGIFNNAAFSPKYAPADSLVSPDAASPYVYIPLKKVTSSDARCIYYQLSVRLEQPNAQIDPANNLSTKEGEVSDGYGYCDPAYGGPGVDPADPANEYLYQVHP